VFLLLKNVLKNLLKALKIIPDLRYSSLDLNRQLSFFQGVYQIKFGSDFSVSKSIFSYEVCTVVAAPSQH
jgi:hypothetical protein